MLAPPKPLLVVTMKRSPMRSCTPVTVSLRFTKMTPATIAKKTDCTMIMAMKDALWKTL